MIKKRIWELDALRGICILGMLVFHLIYDITQLYGLITWRLPDWLTVVAEVGGGVFILLSGLCVTLGSHPVKRGLIVFACGMACTLATWAFGMTIRFGILHCLGICMLLWPLCRKLSNRALTLLGLLILVTGWYIYRFDVTTQLRFMYPLGITYPGFSSGDYYPLIPCLGWFLLGSVLGRTLYRNQTSLLPGRASFLELCGRHSLIIYLVHQPLFMGLLTGLELL